jgi:hypothetical protein
LDAANGAPPYLVTLAQAGKLGAVHAVHPGVL